MATWSPVDLAGIRRRTLLVLALCAAVSSIGSFASVAVSSILARRLFEDEAAAGVPVAFMSVGLAGITIPLSAYMSRAGRRRGLVVGYSLGAAGAAVSIAATAMDNIPVLLAGMVLIGTTYGATILSRYAAADVALPAGRGRAISSITWSLVIGALIGPNLLEVSGKWAASLGLPHLGGPFLLTLAGASVSVVVLHLFLRPDPLDIARAIATLPEREVEPEKRPTRALLALSDVRLAMTAIALVQFVMVSVMAITSAHIDVHHGSLRLAGFVLSAHFVGMFGLSPAAGWITDHLGPRKGLVSGQLVVGVGGVLAWLSPFHPAALSVALFLIGVGWNLNLVGASTLLTGAVNRSERTSVQGFADFLSGTVTVVASLAAGILLAGIGFSGMGVGGVVLMALALAAVSKSTRSDRPVTDAS